MRTCRKRGAIRSRKSPSFRFQSRPRHRHLRTTNSNNPGVLRSNHNMKKFSVFPLIAALAVFVSCQKQPTEEERKAEVERQVQDRLAAERLAADKDRVAKQQAELEAREKALADREAVAAASPTPVVEEPAAPPTEEVVTERSDGGSRSETRSTATYGMFYEKLDPYGEWRETKDYGYVFQPREAESSRDWRPYTEGHWVYSDAGWTWITDESFGWATYHYGRWVRLRRVGWVWVPGEEWAPAWVSWRSSKDYVGWAPLPPEARFDRKSGIQNWADSYYDIGPDQYSFVPSNEFGAEHVRRAVVPAERNINIVIETTNVTRITFSNTTVVNEGPSYDELRSRGQRPIERYRLRRERNFEGPPRVQGNELQISVPVLSEVRNIFRPRRVKERVTEVNVDNGWTSVSDRSAAERARTKIKTEATPPPNAPPKRFVPPSEAGPTSAASTTPEATAAATATIAPAGSATPPSAASATTSTAASPSPRARKSPSVAPTISPSPAATPPSAASASTIPAATPSARARSSPSVAPSMAPSPAATPPSAASATTSPAASPSPRARSSPSVAPTMAPSPAASPTAAETTAASPTPAVSMTPRTRPSPSIPVRISQTPAAKASVPMVPRRTAPPALNTPVPTMTPSAATEPSSKPLPTFTPVKRPPISPRPTLPTPSVAPETSDTARPPMPKDVPRRTMPPRMTPPPVATTPAQAQTPAAAQSPVADERQKNRKSPRPGPTESGTPTPAPSTPPN